MENEDRLRTQLTSLLIESDLRFYRNLVFRAELEPIRSLSMLGLLAHLSMFIYESDRYVGRSQRYLSDIPRDIRQFLYASRSRAKLFDSKSSTVDKFLAIYQGLARANSHWYFEQHRGTLGRIKRALQCDLSVATVEGDLILTNLIAYFNMGFTDSFLQANMISLDNLGPYLQSKSFYLGKYIGGLMPEFGVEREPESGPIGSKVPRIRHRDVKSSNFYRPMAARVAPQAPEMCLLLTHILSSVNVTRHLVPIIAVNNETSLFRLRYVSLYHAVSSLELVLRHQQLASQLSSVARNRIESIVAAGHSVTLGGGKSLCDALRHYARANESLQLEPGLPLFGLVESYLGGKSLAETDSRVLSILDDSSSLLADLLFS